MSATTWDSDADYPREEWVREVVNGDTQRGYWEWVAWCEDVDARDAAEIAADLVANNPALLADALENTRQLVQRGN